MYEEKNEKLHPKFATSCIDVWFSSNHRPNADLIVRFEEKVILHVLKIREEKGIPVHTGLFNF